MADDRMTTIRHLQDEAGGDASVIHASGRGGDTWNDEDGSSRLHPSWLQELKLNG